MEGESEFEEEFKIRNLQPRDPQAQTPTADGPRRLLW